MILSVFIFPNNLILFKVFTYVYNAPLLMNIYIAKKINDSYSSDNIHNFVHYNPISRTNEENTLIVYIGFSVADSLST